MFLGPGAYMYTFKLFKVKLLYGSFLGRKYVVFLLVSCAWGSS